MLLHTPLSNFASLGDKHILFYFVSSLKIIFAVAVKVGLIMPEVLLA